MEGTFTAHPDGYGFVWVADRRDSLFIPPRENSGALDGDWVAVEVVPSKTHRTSGRIAAILERRRLRARGLLERDRGHTWVVPLNLRIPDIVIEPQEGDPDYPSGTLVDVALTAFPRDADEAPAGRIVARAPTGDSPDVLVDSIVANSTLHVGFSPAAKAQAAALTGTDVLAQARREGRTDLTALPFVTIDPDDARDFDDAVFLDAGRPGRERLWVAIADVAAYVAPDSPLDNDALAKGTSVYFPASVLPMLPEVLSNDLCSLRPLEPRLAMVVEMELDGDGVPAQVGFHEAVIRSSARLTYGQVQALFDGIPGAEGVSPAAAEMLLRMKGLAEKLRLKRAQRGALAFSFPEVRFDLDPKGMPVRILRKYPTDATRLVEQFMLEANECVAAHCVAHELPALYRVHDPPPEDQLGEVVKRLWNHRVHAKPAQLRTPKGFSQVLSEVQQHPDRETLELVLLKSTAQAQYRERNEGHFALAAEHYCHFTSPIRRFPDVIVHRAIKAWLHRDTRGTPPPPQPDVGMHLSARERLAADVEQQAARLYRVLYLEPHLGEEFPVTVTGASEKGLTVSLRDEFIESMLPTSALTDSDYRFDRERQVLVGRNRRHVGFGERLVVQLARADRYAARLEFAFRRWGWEAQGAAPGAKAKPAQPVKPAGKAASKPTEAGRAKPAGRTKPAKKGRR
jgi:ribonuclease R